MILEGLGGFWMVLEGFGGFWMVLDPVYIALLCSWQGSKPS